MCWTERAALHCESHEKKEFRRDGFSALANPPRTSGLASLLDRFLQQFYAINGAYDETNVMQTKPWHQAT